MLIWEKTSQESLGCIFHNMFVKKERNIQKPYTVFTVFYRSGEWEIS